MTVRRGTEDAKKGSAEVIILAIVEREAHHGYEIAKLIEARSDGGLTFTLATLYATLYRMEERGWIKSEWGVSENNRRAKFYKLTRTGQKQLEAERANWNRIAKAVSRILQTT
jgi:transcriptional regulator